MNCLSSAAEERIAQSQGLVRSLAVGIHRKLPPHIDLDDLIAYGQVGLVEAARDFDPARGNQFSTFAYYRIRGAIYDGLSKMSAFSRSHYETIRYEQMAGETLRASAEENDGRNLEDGEAGARQFRDLSRSLLVVYLATRNGDGKHGLRDIDIIDPASTPPIGEVIQQETVQKLHELIEGLPSDEALLIRAVYFEGLTLEAAGQKVGISKSWASRLHVKSLQRLGRLLQMHGLGG